jgi:hypothetical protein
MKLDPLPSRAHINTASRDVIFTRFQEIAPMVDALEDSAYLRTLVDTAVRELAKVEARRALEVSRPGSTIYHTMVATVARAVLIGIRAERIRSGL